MRTYFFVESPIQLLNAYEARYYFSVKNNYIFFIRLSGLERNDTQIIFLVDLLQIQNVHYVTVNAHEKNILDYIKIIYYKYLYKIEKYDIVFIGNLYSGFLSLFIKRIKKESIILLDDGVQTLEIQKKFTTDYYYNLFSIYDLKAIKGQSVYKNNFVNIKLVLKTLKLDENQIMFLGTKISEVGIIKEAYYLELMRKISKYYAKKQILYISHRGESKKKLDLLSKIENIFIVSLDYPIELYGFHESQIAYKVSSFLSTALLNMKNIYGVEVECFKFDYSHSKRRDIIENIYQYHKQYMKEIDLDD